MTVARNEISLDLKLRGEQQTARGLRNVGDAAEDAGDDFTKMGRDAGFLDKRIGDLRGELRGLLREFDRTGDMDLIKKINGGNRDLNRFKRLRKQMFDLDEVTETGSAVGRAFSEGFAETMQGVPGPLKAALITGLVGAAAAMTPLLGASIGAAVLGTVGAGGIVGGIAMAARDPKVKEQAAKVTETLSAAFGQLGGPFVQPTIDALKTLEGTGLDVAKALKQPLSDLAPVLKPLAEGIDGLVDNAMPGFTQALEAAKPILKMLADEMPEIGDALGDFFESVSSNPAAATAALHVLLEILEGAIRTTGSFIGAMEDFFEGMLEFAGKILPVMEAAFGWVPGVGEQIKKSREQIDETIRTMHKARQEGEELKALYAKFPALVATYVQLTGVKPAIEDMRELVRLLNLARGALGGAVSGASVGHYASGGDFQAGEVFVAGEAGPELVVAGSTGGHVYNASQTAAMMSGAASGPIQIILSWQPSGDSFIDALMTQILKYVRVHGGDTSVFGVA